MWLGLQSFLLRHTILQHTIGKQLMNLLGRQTILIHLPSFHTLMGQANHCDVKLLVIVNGVK